MTRSTFRGLCVCLATVSLAACQDYDGGFSETKIKEAQYTKNFENAFGKIDPTQDWNLATRGTVTVAADPGSEIKIYAKVDGTYKIVGDYENFSGNGTLNFDMLEGTTDLLVTNGMSSAFAKVGESVNLSSTRTAHPSGTTITVASEYKDFDFSYVSNVISLLPEDGDNRERVTANFSYVSTGSFTIYPIYWNTGSVHTMGVYWKDASGKYHTLPVYDTKVGNELALKVITPGTECNDKIIPFVGAVGKDWPNPVITKVVDGKAYYSGQIQCTDGYYGVGTKCSAEEHSIVKVTGDQYNGYKYWYTIPESQYEEEECGYNSFNVGDECTHGFKISSIDGTKRYHMKTLGECTHDNSHSWAIGEHCCKGHEITEIKPYGGGNWYNGDIEYKGDLKPAVGATCTNGHIIDYVDVYGKGYYESTVSYDYRTPQRQEAFSAGSIVGSKGITINLPVGTQFGFYLDVFDNPTYNTDKTAFDDYGTYAHSVYSQVEVNEEFGTKSVSMSGQTMDPYSSWTGKNVKETYVFGSTFNCIVNGKETKYVCFEDWNLAGPDLQDLVFVIDGDTPPVVVDEDAEEWVICGEDLGGSFDLDYNDVVVSISHVSGKEKANFKALAAGGTLASYVFFGNDCLGEIHELLGADNAASGEYDPLNVGLGTGKVYEKELTVASNFTIATIEGSMDASMGGFHIQVVPQGLESTVTNATVNGQKIQNSWVATSETVPYVFCVPRSWTESEVKRFFRWPIELQPVFDWNSKARAYAGNNTETFKDWVEDNAKRSWYKHPVEGRTIGF